MDKLISVQLKKISKAFGSVIANKDIDLDIRGGEIHALLGEKMCIRDRRQYGEHKIL